MFKKLLELKPETIVVMAMLVVVAGIMSYLGRNRKYKFDTRIIVYGSVSITLSFILSYIRLYRFPQGGSVTPAAMLPLILYSVMFGPLPGMIAGLAFGMLKLMQDAYILHWAQFLLDYPLAYGTVALAGLYKNNNLTLSCVTVGFGRFFMSFLSGVIFFGMYAPEGMSPWLYSLIVNGSVMGADTILCVIIASLPQIKSSINQVKNLSTTER